MNYIKWLDEITRADVDLVGSKAAYLGELMRAGLPVPRGFCFTSQAYHDFVTHNCLETAIQQALTETQFEDSQSLKDSSDRLMALFAAGELPPLSIAELLQAYQPLEEHPVAVRSSATAEDMPEASFAGQYQTYLGVLGFRDVVARIKDCWASLWTVRAMLYRAQQGWTESRVAMAVIVQKMIASQVAGVLFTANPLTGESDELVVNASWGLGEAIVTGAVSPDTYVLDREATLRRVEVGSKQRQVVLSTEGTAQTEVARDRARVRCLNDKQLAALTQLGQRIETLLGTPQDIEWGLAEGQIYVLQARPITALPEAVPVHTPTQPFDVWTRANVGEVFPGVVSPLLWSISKETMSSSIRWMLRRMKIPELDEISFFDLFYGRIYLNEGALAYIFTDVMGLPRSFVETALGTKLTVSTEEGAEGYNFGRILRRLPGLLRNASYALKAGDSLEKELPRIEQEAKTWRETNLSTMSEEELLQALKKHGAAAQDRYRLYNSVNGMAVSTVGSLQDLLKRWTGEAGVVSDLVTGLAGIKTAEMAPALWRIAEQIRAEPELLSILSRHQPVEAFKHLRQSPKGEAIVHQIEDFLREYGHHCTDEYEIMVPRWDEEPTSVIRTLIAYAQAGDAVNPLALAERQMKAHKEAVVKVEKILRQRWMDKLFPIRLMLFRYWLRSAQRYIRLRENGKHYLLMLTYVGRRLFLEIGRRWVDEGWLQQAEDIFFLTWDEIHGFAKTTTRPQMVHVLHRKISTRRLKRVQHQRVTPSDVIRPGQSLSPKSDIVVPTGQVLRGIGVSAGRAEGIARIILDPSEGGRLKTGEILVTRFTDPGWTPLFVLAAGIIMDAGGMLSHGSIVAREYGIPAVVNVGVGTQEIRDGQKIIVDGNRGEVYLQK